MTATVGEVKAALFEAAEVANDDGNQESSLQADGDGLLGFLTRISLDLDNIAARLVDAQNRFETMGEQQAQVQGTCQANGERVTYVADQTDDPSLATVGGELGASADIMDNHVQTFASLGALMERLAGVTLQSKADINGAADTLGGATNSMEEVAGSVLGNAVKLEVYANRA